MYNIPEQEPTEVKRVLFEEDILRRVGVNVKRSQIKRLWQRTTSRRNTLNCLATSCRG